MDALLDLRRRLEDAESLAEIQRLSGVSYRHLLRIKKGEGSTTLRLYERIDAALKVAQNMAGTSQKAA